MIFGDGVRAAVGIEPAGWIASACTGRPGTVGSLVPAGYEAVLRLHPPDPVPEGWWDAYRELFEAIAEVGVRHTSSRERAWFAIWEGHGFDKAASRVAWREPPADEDERREREAYRHALRADDVRRNAAIRAALDAVPRFELPHRRHHLLDGPVVAVSGLRDPSTGGWRHPDLFWPDDRRWFVATDVDIWSVFVGGDEAMIDELAAAVTTRTGRVVLDDPLPIED